MTQIRSIVYSTVHLALYPGSQLASYPGSQLASYPDSQWLAENLGMCTKLRGVNGKALQVHTVNTSTYYRNLHIDSYQVVQVTRAMSKHAMKLEAYKIKPTSREH